MKTSGPNPIRVLAFHHGRRHESGLHALRHQPTDGDAGKETGMRLLERVERGTRPTEGGLLLNERAADITERLVQSNDYPTAE